MTWKQLVDGAASVGILPKYRPRAKRLVVPSKTAEKMLRATFSVIAEKALHGERVAVPGFGVFHLAVRKARQIRNPRTRELMMLPEMRNIGFHASKTVRR